MSMPLNTVSLRLRVTTAVIGVLGLMLILTGVAVISPLLMANEAGPAGRICACVGGAM